MRCKMKCMMGNDWLIYYDTIEPLNSYIEEGMLYGPVMM